MRKWTIALNALVVLLFLAPVAGPAQESTCRVCNMKITEKYKKFSVVMPKVSGMESSAFDDIGCAIAFRNKECATRQSTFDSNAFTYDYGTGEQIAMEKAFFVAGAGAWTPMGYDIVAFKDKEKAEKFVAEKGKGQVLKLYQLVDLDIK